MDRARKWILDHGGATCVPSWGKMWLSVITLVTIRHNHLAFPNPDIPLFSRHNLYCWRRYWMCMSGVATIPCLHIYGCSLTFSLSIQVLFSSSTSSLNVRLNLLPLVQSRQDYACAHRSWFNRLISKPVAGAVYSIWLLLALVFSAIASALLTAKMFSLFNWKQLRLTTELFCFI